jgi:hypothetical protein
MESTFESVFSITFPKSKYGYLYSSHNQKWSWTGVLYDFIEQDITKYDNVNRMGLYEILTFLSIKNERGKIEKQIENLNQ